MNPITGLWSSCRAWPLSAAHARTAESLGAGMQVQQLAGVVVLRLLASVSGLSKDGLTNAGSSTPVSRAPSSTIRRLLAVIVSSVDQ